MPAFDGRPISVIADQRPDHHPPALPQRLQHDAGNAEYAIVIVRAKREQSFGHADSSPTKLPHFGVPPEEASIHAHHIALAGKLR